MSLILSKKSYIYIYIYIIIFEYFFLQLLKNNQKSKLFQGKFKFKLTIS